MKTITWPRFTVLSFSTTTRSSTWSVFSIEVEGIRNIWPDKPSQQRGNNDRADDNNRQFLEEGQHMLAKRQVLGVRIGEFGLVRLGLAPAAMPPRRRLAHRFAMSDFGDQLASRFSLILAALPRRSRR